MTGKSGLQLSTRSTEFAPARPALTQSERANSLREQREACISNSLLQGRSLGSALSGVVDAAIAEAYTAVARDDLVVLALGSYARQELCPSSDVDVLLLHRSGSIANVADALWYPLWDAGFVLGHATRTSSEAFHLAESDLETLTSLLDVRIVAGAATVDADALVHRVRRLARRRKDSLIAELSAASMRRRERPGRLGEVLEPDLKEGGGGLRDIHALGWAGWAMGPGGSSALVAVGALHGEDLEALALANNALLDTRVALHRSTGRPSDRLSLQDQDAVASLLGSPDADSLVRGLSEHARRVSWIAAEAWGSLDSRTMPKRGLRRLRGGDVELAEGVVQRHGVVALSSGAVVDGSLVLRTAAHAALLNARIDRDSLERMRGAAEPLWSADDRDYLIAWLRAGHSAITVAEALDHVGVLSTIFPEWVNVRSMPQRNAYHRFTVDRHLLETVAESAALLSSELGSTDADVVSGLMRPEVLIFSALLHDIGKGQPGDHSEVGAAIARRFAKRVGLDVEGARLLEWLVLNHLLMADTATRRDLDDPATLEQFIAQAKDAETVILLHALTVADSRATGPAAWGPTKSALVSELRERALLAISAGTVTAADVDPFVVYEDVITAGVLAVQWSEIDEGLLQCAVIAPDRPGLLGGVAAALALAGLDISSVNAATHSSGMALEVFTGLDRFGRLGSQIERSKATGHIEAACAGEDFSDRLTARAAAYRSPTAKRGATSVTIDPTASTTASVVEVYADDEVGRFARIAMILSGEGVDVTAARATTIGDRIVDVFYVQINGEKIEASEAVAELRQAIIDGLEVS